MLTLTSLIFLSIFGIYTHNTAPIAKRNVVISIIIIPERFMIGSKIPAIIGAITIGPFSTIEKRPLALP